MRESNEQLRGLLSVYQSSIALLPSQTQAKRGRGRPKKNGIAVSDLDLFESLKAEYILHHPNTKPSDRAVMTWSFSRLFVQHGLRASRVAERKAKGQLKTFLNRLSDAKHPNLPKKSR